MKRPIRHKILKISHYRILYCPIHFIRKVDLLEFKLSVLLLCSNVQDIH